MLSDFDSWESQLAQDSVVSATVTLADKNFQDELFERGASDSQDQGLDRDEGGPFLLQGLSIVNSSPGLESAALFAAMR